MITKRLSGAMTFAMGEIRMISIQTQKKIIAKSLGENKVPFVKEGDSFSWSGQTMLKSKTSGRSYDAEIRILVKSTRRIGNQLQACLCKPEGVRFDDLIIVSMLDPRLSGRIEIAGLPGESCSHDFLKFLKQVSASKET